MLAGYLWAEISTYFETRLGTTYVNCPGCASRELLSQLGDVTYFLAVVLVLVGAVVSRGGAGWFEPTRRPLREYAAELAALSVLSLVLVLPIMVSLACTLWFSLDRTIVTGQGGEILAILGWGLGIGVAGAWTGASLTLAVRSWPVATGVLWVAAVAEVLTVEDGYGNPTMNRLGPWMPMVNYNALLHNGTTYQIHAPGSGTPRSTGWAKLSFEHGLTFFAGFILAVVLFGGIASLIRHQLARRAVAEGHR
ncbi:hypothetical protein [Kribbella flavida]|nr:hypothetical protein [Kribbella flavida]